MQLCAFCKNVLRPWTEWKGNDGQLYYNEFCADAGDTLDPVPAPKAPDMPSAADVNP
jgi:hypothetical protein